MGETPDALVLPDLAEVPAIEHRRLHNLKVDAGDLRQRVVCHERRDDEGGEKHYATYGLHWYLPCGGGRTVTFGAGARAFGAMCEGDYKPGRARLVSNSVAP